MSVSQACNKLYNDLGVSTAKSSNGSKLKYYPVFINGGYILNSKGEITVTLPALESGFSYDSYKVYESRVNVSQNAHLLRYKDVDKKIADKKVVLKIDLKPALSMEQLDARILRDFTEVKNKQFKNSLDKLLPKKMIDVVIDKSKINPDKHVNEITREERLNLVKLLKNFEVRIDGFRPVDEAIVTAGGINVKEINPKTMESKIISGLYFAGEIIDVDAYTGGFNLQIAYSTGFTAGQNL